MSDAKVVELRPGIDLTDEQRLLMTQPLSEQSRCRHQRFKLDLDTRRVYCGECGIEVPVFDALMTLASDVERWIHQRKEMERRARVARAELVEVERLERNAKARARKAVSKVEVCACRSSWSGWGSAYWRFCPICGGTRPQESAERRERDRAAVLEVVQSAGCADLLDMVTKRLAGVIDGSDTDEGLEHAQTFLAERVTDALVPVVHSRRRS